MFIPRFKLRMSPLKILGSFFRIGSIHSYDKVESFEQEFSKKLGMKYSVGMPMARVGIEVLLRSMNFNKGSEVLVSSINIPEVITAIINSGLKPVFIDSEQDSFDMSLQSIEDRVSDKTACAIITHFSGIPQPRRIMNYLKSKNITIIEDCAQSLSIESDYGKLGTIGDASVFSFGSYKIASSFFGGLVCTSDTNLYEKLKREQLKMNKASYFLFLKRMFRDMIFGLFSMRGVSLLSSLFVKIGIVDKILSVSKSTGGFFPSSFYYRFSDFNANSIMMQMPFLSKQNTQRKCISEKFIASISNENVMIKSAESKISLVSFPLIVESRDTMKGEMLKLGIDSYTGNLKACSYLDVFHRYHLECPNSLELMKKVLFVPLYPELSDKSVLKITNYLSKI